jgi:hypothetical membrane protein
VPQTDSSAPALTRHLLAYGSVAGPLFIGTVLVQDYVRPGVRPREQPLSLLALGDLGWIQVGAFVIAGLLNLAFAVGLRRALHPGPAGTWGPLSIAGFGLGLVLAGVFRTDPAFGFPPGAPAGMPAELSWHGRLHDIAALLVFGSLAVATAVFTRWFAKHEGRPGHRRGDRARALASAAAGIAVVALVVVSATPAATSEALRAGVLVGWGWASWLAVRTLAASHDDRG